jgi:histidinol phosphatase-like enzyme
MNIFKAAFLDLNGTLNYEKKYIYKFKDFELLPGTFEALRLFTDSIRRFT